MGYLAAVCNGVCNSSSSPSLPPQALHSVVYLGSSTLFLFSPLSLNTACMVCVPTINIILFNLVPLSFTWSSVFLVPSNVAVLICLAFAGFEFFQHDHTVLVGGILQNLPLTARVIFFLISIKLYEQ